MFGLSWFHVGFYSSLTNSLTWTFLDILCLAYFNISIFNICCQERNVVSGFWTFLCLAYFWPFSHMLSILPTPSISSARSVPKWGSQLIEKNVPGGRLFRNTGTTHCWTKITQECFKRQKCRLQTPRFCHSFHPAFRWSWSDICRNLHNYENPR